MPKKNFTPTRTCPHRWCKPLHPAPLPFSLAVVAFSLWHNWVFLLSIVFGAVTAIWVPRIVHLKRRHRPGPTMVKDIVQDLKDSPTALDLEMQDTHYAGTGWRVLEVRKGWARVAVACDLVFTGFLGLTCTQVFADLDEAARVTEAARPDGSMVVALVIYTAFFAFTLYAHKKATTPRKPKKAWLPAFLRTNV